MLDGQATDALEASALGFKNNHIDIYINCWGPKDDGKTFGKPGPIATNALKEAAEKVRSFFFVIREGNILTAHCNFPVNLSQDFWVKFSNQYGNA